ncbi:hypothetical protein [Gordonibacter massiliensis (ex Traore et al. 2017)]|uniref:Uncharacterized protein n=2 Tax=Gordonibacter massiliensis (ex Traore et al. 2017) TaxID=1841863 RepID=A0A842J8G8_9ACTN|nr:hypothetical protein [Gordonibacter massiliensis (ex Traore et al. 2017)]MBC2888027.1 hypothetical protein [Gordonibacter massiliensis (ex Traore et al. 2017)]MBX9032615.1 hypothetical protein [Gordonibacter massiliensis (ex Traore et al. 2017)]
MARRSMLNRSFSTREKVLMLVLAVLLVAACYYFLVIKNVADTKLENDLQLQEIQQQIDTQTALAMARTRMEGELEKLGDVNKLPVVATYDNIRNELDELNALLAGVGTYDVKFGQPELEGELVRRPVTITYTVPSYDAALNIVQSLQNGSYRCDITDFTLTGKMLADGSIESVNATLDVTYFETTRGATNLSGLAEGKAS